MDIKEQRIRKLFTFTIILKGLNALVDLCASFLLLATGTLTSLVSFTLTYGFSSYGQFFVAFYLFADAVVKIVMVIGLLRNKTWAYPFAITVQIIFIVYQSIQWLFTHSSFVLLLTIFDAFLLYLTKHEWELMKRSVQPKNTSVTL